METYIFKIVLCSSLFILFYTLVLKNEKLLKFNRFYLITTLILSLAIPFLHYETPAVEVRKISGLQIGESQNLLQNTSSQISIFTIQNIIFMIYGLVFFILLIKFLRNLLQINLEISKNEKLKNGSFWLVLKNEKTAPHSFFKYIFINKDDYINGKINEKIILHETAHLNQKHSLDLIFIELILAIFWFNPVFYFYKKAILTNHEYLADDLVLNKTQNLSDYQNLLLAQLISEKILFSNSFNLINTKNRIKMMTKTLSKTAKLKSWLSIPLAAIVFFTFAEKIPAKEINVKSSNKVASKVIDLKTSMTNNKTNFKTEKAIAKMDTIKPKNQNLEKKSETAPPPPPPPPPEKKMNTKLKSPTSPSIPPIVDKVDVSAAYPGGINTLRKLVSETFDTSLMKGDEGNLKTTIFFRIDENGNASNFVSEGENKIFNNEALRSVIAGNVGKVWKPAILKGKPVASVYQLPLTLQFAFANKAK